MVFEERLRRVADRCATHVLELDRVASLAHRRMEKMLRGRYHAECSAVAALAEEVRVAADEARELEHDLLLEEEDFVVLEEERALPPAPTPPPPPPEDPTPALPGIFNAAQIANLCAVFAEAAPTGLATAAECGALIEKCAAVKKPADPGVPGAFAVAGHKLLSAVARLFEFERSPYVEWRALVASLLAAMYPALLDADADVIASAAAQSAAPAAAGKRAFVAARKLWFLPATKPGEVNVSGLVMRGLADAFGEPGEDGVVDVVALAMHLCVSTTPEIGAGKAVRVAECLVATSEGADDKQKRAEWCRAAGPGAMSEKAVELLKKKDLEGKDVDLP